MKNSRTQKITLLIILEVPVKSGQQIFFLFIKLSNINIKSILKDLIIASHSYIKMEILFIVLNA